MTLLKKTDRRRKSSGLRPYTTVLCPYNGHQVSWCHMLCEPIGETGICGRPAPHAMVGRTQAAIRAWVEQRARRG